MCTVHAYMSAGPGMHSIHDTVLCGEYRTHGGHMMVQSHTLGHQPAFGILTKLGGGDCCYLHWWSFSTSNYHIYSTATCGGPIVTCTVWWWWYIIVIVIL